MDKWGALAAIAFVIMSFGGLGIQDYFNSKADVEMAKAGLEECPAIVGASNQTIWVKDCVKYIEKMEKMKKD